MEDAVSPVINSAKPVMEDPEMQELRTRMQSLIEVKTTILQNSDQLERKQFILDEIIYERQRLTREKRMLLDMLRDVQHDLEMANEAEQSLTKETDDLRERFKKVREEEYDPMKDEIDALRLRQGLKRLPGLQEELDAQMARYLEERRERWRENDSEGASSNSKSPSPSPSPGPGMGLLGSSSRRRAASTPRVRSKKRR